MDRTALVTKLLQIIQSRIYSLCWRFSASLGYQMEQSQIFVVGKDVETLFLCSFYQLSSFRTSTFTKIATSSCPPRYITLCYVEMQFDNFSYWISNWCCTGTDRQHFMKGQHQVAIYRYVDTRKMLRNADRRLSSYRSCQYSTNSYLLEVLLCSRDQRTGTSQSNNAAFLCAVFMHV